MLTTCACSGDRHEMCLNDRCQCQCHGPGRTIARISRCRQLMYSFAGTVRQYRGWRRYLRSEVGKGRDWPLSTFTVSLTDRIVRAEWSRL
jgi:hypothetical protein